MPWPSTLGSFSNPIPSDRLNSPSHSSVETAQNTALTELQTFIGVNTGATASVVGTLLYDVKSPASDGGGHVQAANRGGTGQTTYTLGNILVAANSSTLSRVTVGSDGQVLAANSSTATGVNWVNATSNKVSTSASVVTIPNDGNLETSVLSTTVTGSTLGTNNVIRTTIPINPWRAGGQSSLIAIARYGGQTVASVALLPMTSTSVYGNFHHTIIANDSASLQRHFLDVDLVAMDTANTGFQNTVFRFTPAGPASQPSVVSVRNQVTGTSSINSSADQTLGMTLRIIGGGSSLDTGGHIVERIV